MISFNFFVINFINSNLLFLSISRKVSTYNVNGYLYLVNKFLLEVFNNIDDFTLVLSLIELYYFDFDD